MLAGETLADTFTVTTTGEQTYTVPAGVGALHVRAAGGRGGNGTGGALGGSPTLVETNLGVMPGQVLYLTLATSGAHASGTSGGIGGLNGGNGGGNGVVGNPSFGGGTGGGGGGGGGASDIRTVSGSLSSRVVVASGGGGGGGSGVASAGGPGGNGGAAGANGTQGGGCSGTPGVGGGPGGETVGGVGGAAGGGSNPGQSGGFGLGGMGGGGTSLLGGNGGGGGAGGWWGGGGGGATASYCAGAGGGGGGASHVDTSVTAQTGYGSATSPLLELHWMPPNGGGSVVISQVYGGGQAASPTYANDFVELFNRSAGPVDVSGWSVQYASATGSSWQSTVIPAGTTIPAGAYLLVQQAGGPAGGALPTPDVTGTFAMSQTTGKVALMSAPHSSLSGLCPRRNDPPRSPIVDFVGYGYAGGNALTCFEGSSFAPTLSATTAAKRTGAGCLDTDDNAADFPTAVEPDPHNSQSPVANCGAPANILPPTMTGTPALGSTLTCTPGTWQSNPAPSLSYRFVRSIGGSAYTPIPGSTSAQHTVTAEDVGSRVACEEIATNPNPPNESAVARSNSKVAAAGAPFSVEPPSVSGSPIIGQTLSCSNGAWDNGPLSFSRIWLRNGAEIGGATTTEYVPTDADRGARIACRVTATNDVGSGSPATSGELFVVKAAPVNQGRPTLALETTGPRPTDKLARCSPGSWSDDPGGPYEFVIQRAGAEVVATENPYQVTAADLGRELVCIVTLRNVAGSGSATSAPLLVPLPPVSASAGGPARMFKAGGTNEFDPVNMLATSDGLQRDLQAAQEARVKAAFDAFVLKCRSLTLDPGPPTSDPRVITDPSRRETELCRLILNTPTEQFVIGHDGARIVADPSKCIMGTGDPCAVLPIPMPAASDLLQAPVVNVNTVPERIIWDFNADGRVDADCPGTAPVARTIFRPGYYNVRAVLVMPGSEETGQYPSATLTLKHHPPSSTPSPLSKLVTYAPGGTASVRFGARVAQVPTGGAGGSALELGTTRKAQPFTCRTALQPPPERTQPCGTQAYLGKVRLEGNLCPISLRSIPQTEVNALKASDPDVYNVLVAQNDALGAAARRRAPSARPALTFGTTTLAATSIALQQFASPIPERFAVTRGVRSALLQADIASIARAPLVLDQIFISRGPAKVNGVTVAPRTGSVLFVPSDTGEAIKSVKSMVVSASNARTELGGIALDAAAGQFKQNVNDARAAAEQVFKTVDLDAIARQLRSKLPDLGPFRLAGNATVRLADGVATLEAYAELPALLTAPGASPIRVNVTIRARPDGSVKLDGVRLRAGQAYLGAIKVKDLDLLYDGGLTVRGKLLFPPVDAGIDIQEFRIDDRGRFRSLVLAYLAGAGTGIPVGPGVFLTKVGGGLTLDPDEIRALAAVSVGPSAGGGCPTVGADGNLVLHFGPPPFYIATNADLQLVCLSLAQVDFLARQDGYVTLGARMGFEGGPLYFSASLRGTIFMPNWQVEGSGEGGIRKILSGRVNVVVSNRGLAGCGSVDLGLLGSISGGAGVRYNPSLLLGPHAILANLKLFTGCDLSSYKTIVAAPARAAAPAGSRSVTVARGERALVLAVDGDTAAPRALLRGPDGTVLDVSGDDDSARTRSGVAARADDERRTFFLVGRPAAGRWTVEPADGSARIVRIQRAEVLPKPRVRARVRGKGALRTVTWTVERRPGQVVRLVEEADGGAQPLTTIRGGGRGSKRFVVADARGTRRRIVAQVEQDGLPRANLVAATFSARSARVGKPGRVRVRRKARGALVTWSPAFHAVRYEVVVERSRGGRQVLSPRGSARKLAIPRLRPREGVTVSVVGISRNGQRGRPGKGKLAAQRPAKRRSGRGRR